MKLWHSETIYLKTLLVIGIARGMHLKGLKSSKLNLSLKNRTFMQNVFTKFKWFRVLKNFYEIIQDPIEFEKWRVIRARVGCVDGILA